MTVRLQDTLSGETRPLEPLEPGHVRIYSCGPTVYGPAHIGNFRSFLFADLLVRQFETFRRVECIVCRKRERLGRLDFRLGRRGFSLCRLRIC